MPAGVGGSGAGQSCLHTTPLAGSRSAPVHLPSPQHVLGRSLSVHDLQAGLHEPPLPQHVIPTVGQSSGLCHL